MIEEEGLTRKEAREMKRLLWDHLNYVWDRYEIPIIHLPSNLQLFHVAKIFEKLNSTGMPLTVFDLLNARLIKHKITLRKMWDDSLNDYPLLKKFSEANEKFPVYVLQVISLLRKSACKGRDLLELEPTSFRQDWDIACKHLEETLKLVTSLREDGFGVISPKWVPYYPMIPVMAALLEGVDAKLDRPKKLQKIFRWYWASAFTSAYEGSTETQMANDYKDLKEWFDNDKEPQALQDIKDDFNKIIIELENVTKSSRAIYKAIMCITSIRSGKDFLTDKPIELNKLDDHHIFPKSKAGKFGKGKDQIDSILNKTLIDEDTNRHYIRSNEPSLYLKKIMRDQRIGEKELRKRLKTHLISDDAFDCMLKDDLQNFLNERKKTIEQEIKKRI